MRPKPDIYSRHNASAFQGAPVADAYRFRPEYPAEVFEVLARLAIDTPRRVLDVGTGTGFVARPLVTMVDGVDAVDISPEMVNRGRALLGGDDPRLTWIVGAAEEVELTPPYALITAGDSLHWLDWEVVMPRFADLLSLNGVLAVLTVDLLSPPWQEQLLPVLRRYSTYKRWQQVNLFAELEERGLFHILGEHRITPVPFLQPADEYIESFHGRASLSRLRMTPEDAGAFDAAVQDLVEPYGPILELQVDARITWGKPLRPGGSPRKRKGRSC